MHASYFDAVAYDGQVFCIDCLCFANISIDADGVMPIFANQEWDRIPICEACGVEHDYVVIIRKAVA